VRTALRCFRGADSSPPSPAPLAFRSAGRLERVLPDSMPSMERRGAGRCRVDGVLRRPSTPARARISRSGPAGPPTLAAESLAGPRERPSGDRAVETLPADQNESRTARAFRVGRTGGRSGRRTERRAVPRLQARAVAVPGELGVPLLPRIDADGPELPGRRHASRRPDPELPL